jgi:hypothetical protein
MSTAKLALEPEVALAPHNQGNLHTGPHAPILHSIFCRSTVETIASQHDESTFQSGGLGGGLSRD